MTLSLQSRVRRLDNARYNGGRRGADPSILTWHTTRGRGSALSSIQYLNDVVRCSYHYLIDRDGTIYRMTHTDLVAYSNGDSAWPNPKRGDGTESCKPHGGRSLNAIAISIAWANYDGEDLTPEQIESGLWLAKVYMARFDIPLSLNLGHYEISPNRKPDPLPAIDMNNWRRQIAEYLEAA